jgi:hypothetical protein
MVTHRIRFVLIIAAASEVVGSPEQRQSVGVTAVGINTQSQLRRGRLGLFPIERYDVESDETHHCLAGAVTRRLPASGAAERHHSVDP